jgi:hypothetical protein
MKNSSRLTITSTTLSNQMTILQIAMFQGRRFMKSVKEGFENLHMKIHNNSILVEQIESNNKRLSET